MVIYLCNLSISLDEFALGANIRFATLLGDKYLLITFRILLDKNGNWSGRTSILRC